jgi:parvulin-like peptidyl-prolyl isomerase
VRSAEEALLEANQILDLLHDSEAPTKLFGSLALERSDDNSYIRSGDLGRNTRPKWHPAFSDAAFELEVGEISGVIASPSGLHIIMRTA